MIRTKMHFVLVLSLALVVGQAAAIDKPWPQVAPLKEKFHFEDGSKASARVTLRSPSGKSLYLLECHAKGYEGDPEFDYSGDFECRLKSLYSKERYSTLLTDRHDQKRDWESRGRFLVEELVGKCGEYPEFGRLRNFDLRGTRITLEMANLLIAESSGTAADDKRAQIKSFDFNVVVQPNPKAKRAIAAQVGYVEPPYSDPKNLKDLSRNCDRVVRR